jgi:hypothetical protein
MFSAVSAVLARVIETLNLEQGQHYFRANFPGKAPDTLIIPTTFRNTRTCRDAKRALSVEESGRYRQTADSSFLAQMSENLYAMIIGVELRAQRLHLLRLSLSTSIPNRPRNKVRRREGRWDTACKG